jgi:hypothetical protein
LHTIDLYLQNKTSSGDYTFGDLTLKYNEDKWPDRGAHWKHSIAKFQEVHDALKPVIIHALTNEMEIHWSWEDDARADAKKGAAVIYNAATRKYSIAIFGFGPLLT